MGALPTMAVRNALAWVAIAGNVPSGLHYRTLVRVYSAVTHGGRGHLFVNDDAIPAMQRSQLWRAHDKLTAAGFVFVDRADAKLGYRTTTPDGLTRDVKVTRTGNAHLALTRGRAPDDVSATHATNYAALGRAATSIPALWLAPLRTFRVTIRRTDGAGAVSMLVRALDTFGARCVSVLIRARVSWAPLGDAIDAADVNAYGTEIAIHRAIRAGRLERTVDEVTP